MARTDSHAERRAPYRHQRPEGALASPEAVEPRPERGESEGFGAFRRDPRRAARQPARCSRPELRPKSSDEPCEMVQLVCVSVHQADLRRHTACQCRTRLRERSVLTSKFDRYDLMSDMA